MSECKAPTDPDHKANFKVGIGVRMVPAGVSGGYVRASLVLSPISAPSVTKACGEAIDIREWPLALEAMLQKADLLDSDSNITVGFIPVGATNKPPEVPTADLPKVRPLPGFRAMFNDQKETPHYGDWKKRRDKDVEAVVEMWKRLVAPNGDSDWCAIVGALTGASAASGFKRLSPDKDNVKPDIRGIGRGQAALLLSLARGRSLLARTKLLVEGAACLDRGEECDLGAPRSAEMSYLTRAQRDAAGNPDELRRKEKEARDEFEKKPSDWQQQRLDELRADAENDGIKTRREAAEARQKRIAEKLANLAKAGAASRKQAYRDLLKCSTTDDAAQCLAVVAGNDASAVAKSIDDSAGRHGDAVRRDDILRAEDPNNPPPDNRKEYEKAREANAPLSRLFGIQSQPSLARLFNLTVDILIPWDQFVGAARDEETFHGKEFPERRGVAGSSRFGFLSAAVQCRESSRRVWTVCKVRLAAEGAPRDDVWACTKNELDLFAMLSGKDDRNDRDDLIAEGALSQVDGVVHLAASRKNGDVREPRFDIISLDSAQAIENRETAKAGAKERSTSLVTLRSSGLALVDRWREAAALTQAIRSLRRDDSTDKNPVVDAEDLTVGYRMDVAVRSKVTAGKLEWRSLCNRSITFSDTIAPIEAILQRTIPKADRAAFDAAIVVMPAKIQKVGDANHDTAHVEDTVGHWTGPPIGIDANSEDIDLTSKENQLALQLGQCYSLLPAADQGAAVAKAARIPPLFFGGGYHFGLAPRLQGGVIRRLDGYIPYGPLNSSERSPSEPEKYFGILPCPTTGPRRFLRHERIEAPIVTTPRPILDRIFDGVVDGLRESADTIVVRSRPVGDDSRMFAPLDQHDGKPTTGSYRVIVPPSVSAEFADRHNVFVVKKATDLLPYTDHNGHRWHGPADGLADIDYDQPAGGFPTYGYSATSRGRLETVADARIKPSGDAVFRPRSVGGGARPPRRDPYYPDPAAYYVVVAVRDLAGRLLPGVPLVVPVQLTGDYPKVRPIALEVVAMTERSGKRASQSRILGLQSTRLGGYLSGTEAVGKPGAVATVRLDGSDMIGSGSVAASRVRVALEPGESYEIDMWCLPRDHKQLAELFDVIESAALVASVDRATGQTCISCDEFALRLEALQLDQLTDFMTRLGLSRAAANSPICGSAQFKVPLGALLCVAEAAYRLLQSRPTPELAARKTVTVTHAIQQPFNKPKSQLNLFRVAADAAPDGTADDKQVVMIEGSVQVDRPTTGLFEIRAEGASLVTNAFDDDQRRRRTPDEVARGIWPRSPVTDDRMTIADVYGFGVDSEGLVTLAAEQATLLRVDDDIEAPDPGAPGMADRDIGVLRQALQTVASGGNTVRMNAPFTITDSRARILKIWAVAGSRTAACFRDEKGDILESAIASERSDPQCLVVQATKAPAKVAPITILPAFHLKQLQLHDGTIRKFIVERRIRLRIRMRRPWYSSGEGERLGIVLWPPDILNERIAPSGASVARDYDTGTGEKADIAMSDFADEDLGPGGDFVTRWGLDPIKGSGELGWLVPPTAFADLANAVVDDGTSNPNLPQDPVYVPRASIPIPVDDGNGKRQTSMEAALLTFVPRFDVDHENWFCDVELKVGTAPEPFIRLGLVRYQPFAPAALRVSEPVVEWAQVPQDRLVVASIDTAKPTVVEVVACGSGSAHGAPPPWGYDPGRIESLVQKPMMKITVMKRRSDGVSEVARLDAQSSACRSGFGRRAERAWVPLTQAEWEHRLTLPTPSEPPRRQLAVAADPPGRTTTLYWRTDFELDDTPLDPKVAGTGYSVLIEEVQPMLPATFPDEPTESAASSLDKKRQALAVSGPRFAAIVELSEKGPSTPKPAVPPSFKKVEKPPKKKRVLVPRKRAAPAEPTSTP